MRISKCAEAQEVKELTEQETEEVVMSQRAGELPAARRRGGMGLAGGRGVCGRRSDGGSVVAYCRGKAMARPPCRGRRGCLGRRRVRTVRILVVVRIG